MLSTSEASPNCAHDWILIVSNCFILHRKSAENSSRQSIEIVYRDILRKRDEGEKYSKASTMIKQKSLLSERSVGASDVFTEDKIGI